MVRKLVEGHPSNFRESLGSSNIKPLEGAVEFLYKLSKNGDYTAIITGNLEEPGRLILERAGLTNFFHYMNFDDGMSERKEIVNGAIKEAHYRMYNFKKLESERPDLPLLGLSQYGKIFDAIK